MKSLLLVILIATALPIVPILSHGYDRNCSEECNDYYCPPKHQLEKKEKEKVKNNIPSKK